MTIPIVKRDSFYKFMTKQGQLASRLYPEELRQHFNVFSEHVTETAGETFADWRTTLPQSKQVKVENFIKKYKEDLEENLKSFVHIDTYEGISEQFWERDDVPKKFDSRIDYYLSRTDVGGEESLRCPHPDLIMMQKRICANLVAMQMKSDLANLRVLETSTTDGDEDYVPLDFMEGL